MSESTNCAPGSDCGSCGGCAPKPETTEMTCETCGEHLRAIVCPICHNFDLWKPRHSVQDADEFSERPGRYGDKSRVIFKARTPDMKEVAEIFDRDLFDRFYQRRTSRPMSADVEKAIDRIGSLILGLPIDKIQAAKDLDLIVAAIKEKV